MDPLRESCPACGETTPHHLLLSGTPGYGSIYRCDHCTLTRLLPLPDPGRHVAQTTGMYTHLAGEFSPWKHALAQRSAAGYLAHLRALDRPAPGSLADLQGGLGYYSLAFAEQGLRVTYVDIDDVSLEHVRGTEAGKHITVHHGTTETFCAEADADFDILFFRHAIEHCTAPGAILAAMRNLAHPDTTLILETDNNLGIELLLHPTVSPYWRGVYRDHYQEASLARLKQLRPLAIDADETHYYAFRIDNLTRLLERTGWRVLDAFPYPLGDPTYWPNVPAAHALRWWRPKRDLGRWWREVVYRLAFPGLRRRGWLSGIAVYATPA